uniref:Uncharacterized protein n=1 Tax=Panagrolaimus sp. JU765 TaxID=591449 RepID=A0AC34R0S0_9BILA
MVCLYNERNEQLFGSNEPLVSITVFANGTAIFNPGEKIMNLKTIIQFFDIGNSTLASGFTLTGTNIADFLEIHFKPGNIGFDKNLDPKQPVADAFVGSIGFYAVAVVAALIVLGLIGGLIGCHEFKKGKMEKAKLLVDDKKTPNDDGKKAANVQNIEKKKANDEKNLMVLKDCESVDLEGLIL